LVADAPLSEHGEMQTVRIWDPLIRVFHWSLVVFFTASWLLGAFGPSIMTLHFYSGYVICGLLGFRIVWGLVGPETARFASFLAGPLSVARYAVAHLGSREPSSWPGHNPLGGWSVLVMLILLSVQVATGLIADPEDYINVGPLASFVDIGIRRTATAVHEVNAWLLAAMVILHVTIIFYYRVWKREDLISPMINGWKRVRKT